MRHRLPNYRVVYEILVNNPDKNYWTPLETQLENGLVRKNTRADYKNPKVIIKGYLANVKRKVTDGRYVNVKQTICWFGFQTLHLTDEFIRTLR